MTEATWAQAQDDAVDIARSLIRIDTTNTGDADTTAGEREAAELVATLLDEVGIEATYLESEHRRANVVARIAGKDPSLGALLVHGHLDVVPAVADDWQVHPLSGEITDDGYLWGRGAVDMKHMVAMTLAAVRRLARTGEPPERDLVLAFVADEERGGVHGARWLVDNQRDLFDGVSEAIGEVGGFSITAAGGRRAYLVQTAEKSAGVLTLTARGRAGHGSIPNPDSAVSRLCEAALRIQRHRFPVTVTEPAAALLRSLEQLTGLAYPLDDPQRAQQLLGRAASVLDLSLRDTVNVTTLDAGYADNVVPGAARATVDCRILPGRQAAFEAELDQLLGDLRDDPHGSLDWHLRTMPAVQTPFEGPVVTRILEALAEQDPGTAVLPYLLPASTDAKTFYELGAHCFGFAPLRLPSDLDFAALFHGIDERVPLDALRFGTRVLLRVLSPASSVGDLPAM